MKQAESNADLPCNRRCEPAAWNAMRALSIFTRRADNCGPPNIMSQLLSQPQTFLVFSETRGMDRVPEKMHNLLISMEERLQLFCEPASTAKSLIR